MTDLSDELRIIATETRLSAADRARIVEAADSIEQSQRALTNLYQEFLEANARRVAATERLLELRPPSWSMSSGWVRLV
jgi:hypothetical protein